MIFLFDKFKTLKGTVRNRHTISLLYERERNGLYTVSAEIPIKITDKKTVYNYHKKVQDSDFLGHYDREGRFQLHKIASVDIEGSSIFIKGVHLFFDEAKAGAIIQERRFRDREIIDGARVAFDAIGWSVVDFDTSDTEDYIFYNVSPLEARAILVETFGFEFDYWLDFDGKNIRNKQISVKREMGKDSNKRYNYGHNVLNIKVEQDYSEIYTAVIGRGKGEDLGDDAYGRRIEYTDVEWKTPTHPMNKPKGSRVLHDENATQLFGYHEDGKVSPRTKVEIFEDIEDPAKLLRASYNWLRENSVPKAVFSLEVPDGDGLDLGDKVHVIYRDIDLVKHTRVTKVVDDLVSGNRDVEFGDTAYFKTDRRLSGVKSELKRVGGSMSSRLSRLKAEFDRRFDNEVQQWKDDFEQAVIDAEAAVEVMRVTMTEEFEAAQKEFEEEFNQSVADAKEHAEQQAQEKADSVQSNLDRFSERHQQLYDEVTGNIVDIDTFLGDKSETLKQQFDKVHTDFDALQTDLDGIESDLTATKTDLQNQLDGTRTELENKIDATEEALNQVGEDLGNAKTDLQRQLDEARAELDGLEVGGRNLLPAFTSDKWSHANLTEVEDYSLHFPSGHTGNSMIFLDVEEHTDYTMTFNSDYARYYIYEVLEDGSLGSIIRTRTGSETYTFNTEDISRIRVSINTFSGNVPEEKNIWNIKLEKGTVATDWTPALEDTDAKISAINKLIEENQESIASAEESISTAEQKIEDASQTLAEHGSSISKQGVSIENIEGTLSTKASQSELDDVKGTVTQHDTSIKQNATKIASKADTSTVDTLRGTVTSQGTLITQTAEELASKASQSEVDTLKGTVTSQGTSITQNANEIASKADSSEVNALKETVTQQGTSITQNSEEIASRATKKELKDVKDGLDSGLQTVGQTLSEHETSITQNAESIQSKADSKEVDALKGTVTRQGTLLTQTADEVSSKAEKSVVDTLTGRVSNAESSVTQNANEIAKKLTKSDYDEDKKATDAKITQWSNTASETAEGLTRVIGRVSQTEKGVETAQTRIEAEAGRIDGVLSRTSKVEGQVRDAELAIEANADGLALRATKTEVEQAIDGIEVGGRNLVPDSNNFVDSKWAKYLGSSVSSSEKLDDGYSRVKTSGGTSFIKLFYMVSFLKSKYTNREVTLSFDLINHSENDMEIGHNWLALDSETIPAGYNGRYVKTGKISGNAAGQIQFRAKSAEDNLDFSIRNLKIEVGNVATDWTPAPEDIDASISEVTDRVTTAEAELVVQAGEISQRATQSELDRVTGRVSTAETSIIQNADEIARRLVKSDYDSDKQVIDAEITEWSNLASETSEGLTQTIRRLSTEEGKISKAQADIIANADGLSSLITRVDETELGIESVSTSLSAEAGKISTLITKTDGHDSKLSELSIDVDGFKATVSSLEDEMVTGFSEFEQTLDGFSQTVGQMEHDLDYGLSTINQKYDSISSRVANIKLNTRNLVRGTDFEDPEMFTLYGNSSVRNVDGQKSVRLSYRDDLNTSTVRFEEYVHLKANEDYYLVVDHRSYSTDEFDYLQIQLEDGSYAGLYDADKGGEGLTNIPATGTDWHQSVMRIRLTRNLSGRLRIGTRFNRGTTSTGFIDLRNLYLTNTLNREWVPHPRDGQSVDELVERVSDIEQTADEIRLSVSDSTGLASVLAVSSTAMDIIADNLNLTGNMNVKGQIESISVSAVRGDIAYLRSNILKADSINANMIQSNVISSTHINVTEALLERIVSRHIFTKEVKALSIDAVEANIGSIRSQILTSNVVLSSHINSSNALIDKIFSSQARFERMMSKSAFVRTLNTVTIDTDQITIRRPDGARLVNNGMLQASFDVQIRPNHASSDVQFTGINYATSSADWKTFEHFYTDHKGSKLLVSWAVDFYGPSASEYVEVRVRGFGNNNPIGTSPKRIFTNGSTAYLNHTVNLGVPDYSTIQAYLEFRRSPTGTNQNNTVRVRVLRVSIID